MFSMLVFQLSKQRNRTRTTPSAVLRITPEPRPTALGPRDSLWKGLEALAFLVGCPRLGTKHHAILEDCFFTIAGADAPGAQHR